MKHAVKVKQLAGTEDFEISCDTCEERGNAWGTTATSEVFASSIRARHILKWQEIDG